MATKLSGVVVSTAMDKTAVVEVTHLKKHPIYQKRFKVSKRFMVHDPQNQTKVGDKVVIVETRPISKHKHWLISSDATDSKKAKS